MRQREEQNITRLQLIARRELQLGALAQIGMLMMNVLARVMLRRDLRHFHLRMKQQQAQQFAAGITRCAYNRNLHAASVSKRSLALAEN